MQWLTYHQYYFSPIQIKVSLVASVYATMLLTAANGLLTKIFVIQQISTIFAPFTIYTNVGGVGI